MSQYDVGRPQQDVRLRNWPSGRLAQLKLAVDRLETAVNETISASVEQSARRQVSDQVPFILDLTLSPGYRQVQVTFTPPPGLGGHPRRQLLFYEIQHDTDQGFGNPTVVQTPQTSIVLGGLGLGEQRFFRARVINTRNEASPWTPTESTTTAQGTIVLTSVSDQSIRVTRDIGDFQTVLETKYTPAGGAITLNAQLALSTPPLDVEFKLGSLVSETFRGGPASIQWRWRVGTFNDITLETDFVDYGQRGLLTARPGYTDTATTPQFKTPTAFGTVMTPFERFDSSLGERTFQLQVALIPGSEWQGEEVNRALLASDPLLFICNTQILEVLENF